MDINKSYYAIIPANVRYDKQLSANAKLLYGEITALCNEKGYCWAGNSYFSELYGVSDRAVSRWIKELSVRGYIVSEMVYDEKGKEILYRKIQIACTGMSPNVYTYGQNCLYPPDKIVYTPIDKNVGDNNTYTNNTEENNTERNINYVNKESESLSDNVTLYGNGDVTKCNASIDIYETPQGEIPFTENPYTENPTTENPTQLNTDILNTNQPTTDRTNNDNTIVHFGDFSTTVDNSTVVATKPRRASAAADIEEFFECVWKLYPKKTNKTQIRKAAKERLYKIGYEKIARCIERYKQELEYNHTEYQFIKAGSTFFNGGYEDYLADDWRLPPKRAMGQRHDYMPNRTPEEQAALEAKLAEYKFD